MELEVIISECKDYISLTVNIPNKKSLSWEELQKIKDRYFSYIDFIEVFPKKKEIINKANVRHLIHIKNWDCVKLKDLERDSIIKIKKYINE